MADEASSKASAVKVLAVNGKFSECERQFGSKAANKAREYVQKKLAAYKTLTIEEVCEDPNVSDFMKFALKSSNEDLDQIVSDYSAEHASTPSEPNLILSQEEIQVENHVTTLVEPSQEEAVLMAPAQESICTAMQDLVLPVPNAPAVHPAKVKVKGNKSGESTSKPKSKRKESSSGGEGGEDGKRKMKKVKKTKHLEDVEEDEDGEPLQEQTPGTKKSKKNKKSNQPAAEGAEDEDAEVMMGGPSLTPSMTPSKTKVKPAKVYVDAENAHLLSDKQFEKLINKPMHREKLDKAPKSVGFAMSQAPVVNGVKQQDLPDALDLLHMKAKKRTLGRFPNGMIDENTASGSVFAFILPAYREFMSQLPTDIIPSDVMETIQTVCSVEECVLMMKFLRCEPIDIEQEDPHECYLVTMKPVSGGKDVTILYVPLVSNLLSTDAYVIPEGVYAASFMQPYLMPSAPVRKLFATANTSETNTGVWIEGTIYHIKEDFQVNPYRSISIVWLEQEADTNRWVYEYGQTDNYCSPWELELSQFYLLEKLKPMTLPSALSIGRLQASVVLKYIESLDAAEYFRISVKLNEEYVSLYPEESDQLDLLQLSEWCQEGRYEDKELGIFSLFTDIERMIHHSKVYNESNSNFLPWRLADVLEKTVVIVKQLLCVKHGAKAIGCKEGLVTAGAACVTPLAAKVKMSGSTGTGTGTAGSLHKISPVKKFAVPVGRGVTPLAEKGKGKDKAKLSILSPEQHADANGVVELMLGGVTPAPSPTPAARKKGTSFTQDLFTEKGIVEENLSQCSLAMEL